MKCIPGHIRTGQPAGQIKHGRWIREGKREGEGGGRGEERKRKERVFCCVWLLYDVPIHSSRMKCRSFLRHKREVER